MTIAMGYDDNSDLMSMTTAIGDEIVMNDGDKSDG